MSDKRALCRFVTNQSQQCSRRQAPSSLFCWQHQLRAGWKLAGVATLLFSATTWIISESLSEAAAVAAQAERLNLSWLERVRELPRVATGGRPVDVVMGGYVRLVPGSRAVHPVTNVPLTVGLDLNGQLLLTGELRDMEGRIAALLLESRLYVTPGIDYDVNWNATTLEVIEPDGQPVLQAIIDPGGKVLINFTTFTPVPGQPNRVQVLQGEGQSIMQVTIDKNAILAFPKLALFRYPGYKYPGCYRDAERCGP